MTSVALALKDIPLENVTFVQYPGTTGQGGIYSGKVMPLQGKADALFDYIKSDEPFKLANTTDGIGATIDPNAEEEETPSTSTATPADTADLPTLDIRGQTAADKTCSKPR